ncbi:RNA polymerase sigma factor [Rhodobacteraceae bacterium NNCM2]|nr:RNA polymerase sigma factor [Coraliihabitans acroporae]
MLDEATDHRLALAAAQGDRAAFSRLVERHYDRIHGLAWRFTGGPPDSEDLAHDVCVALGARIRSFRGEARFTTWLYQVVLNAARDGMRRQKSRSTATAAFAEVDALRRGDAAARESDAGWLREAIRALSDSLRETAVLVLDEGLSHAEAAEVLEISEGTVSWRLAEIRKALKARAQEEGTIA